MEKDETLRYALHSMAVQEFTFREDPETFTVSAVLTREGVYSYGGVRMYEPAEEIEKAAFTAQNAWVVENHPPEGIVVNPAHIRGTVRNPVFVEDRIKADLVFFKDRCSREYLEKVKTGEAKSVSIGFFYRAVPERGVWNGESYDYVQRDILIDHVAVGSWQGRCSYPACGIGVDAKEIGEAQGNPYPNEHSCRLRDPADLDIVGSGERESDGKRYRIIFGKPKGRPEAGSVEQAYRYPIDVWTEAQARAHCRSHGGTFEPATGGGVLEKAKKQEGERERLREAARRRQERYGIRFREGEGHLTPPAGYPTDEEDYGDPVNYRYPLVPERRCRNALARWSQFREAYSQPERNVIYERIVRRALQYGIAVRYNPDLPEARALPDSLKRQLVGYETAEKLIAKVKALVQELKGS